MWINEKGTPMYNKIPLMKTEYIFDSRFSMESVVQAIHNSDMRMQWDSIMASKEFVRKVGRVELMKVSLKPHKLAPQKRDIFEKKFGWCYRPPLNHDRSDVNQSIASDASPRKQNLSARSDQIENYFFFSSMDSKESKIECPEEPDTVRTHVYFGMHKFEFITRLK